MDFGSCQPARELRQLLSLLEARRAQISERKNAIAAKGETHLRECEALNRTGWIGGESGNPFHPCDLLSEENLGKTPASHLRLAVHNMANSLLGWKVNTSGGRLLLKRRGCCRRGGDEDESLHENTFSGTF